MPRLSLKKGPVSQQKDTGRFPFNKNSKIPCCTDPTQATARLVIVLASRIQKTVLGTTILSNGKEHFGPTDRNDQTGQRGPTTFKADPEYSGRTKPKWSVPFYVATEITGILG